MSNAVRVLSTDDAVADQFVARMLAAQNTATSECE
jgi:hypothetical protein